MSFTSTLTGGLLGDSPDYAGMAARNERKRKGIINLGLEQIGAVFGGGPATFYQAPTGDKFDPKQTYYTLTGKGKFAPYWAPGTRPGSQFTQSGLGTILSTGGFDPTGMLGMAGVKKIFPGLFGDTKSPRQIAREKFNKGLLFSAPQSQTFEGFGDKFYNERRDAYLNFALPQVADQYRSARDAMLFTLANRGLGNSSVATRAASDLERTSGAARQAVGDEALRQVTETKRGVEDARQQAIQMLYQTADPSQATAQAIRTAAGFQAPSTFLPVANMFNNFADQYVQENLARRYANLGLGGGFNAFSGGPYLAPV